MKGLDILKRKLTQTLISRFGEYLKNEEKSSATVEKYIRDVRKLFQWCKAKEIDKKDIINYKDSLADKYTTISINSMLSSINSFFVWCGWHELKVKTIKCQKQIFAREEKELTKEEYKRLLNSALNNKNDRLYHIMQTICSSGIRVSELPFITVEAVKNQRAEVKSKGKNRTVFLPKDLCLILKTYADKNKIKSGSIFVSKSGKPLSRTNIWADMKKLCESANVSRSKVFPHNLRHLFARTFYSQQKDIVRLADILGHSSINTTRIYTTESGKSHIEKIEQLRLVYMRI